MGYCRQRTGGQGGHRAAGHCQAPRVAMLAVRRSACFYTTVGLCETSTLFFFSAADAAANTRDRPIRTRPACRHVVVPAWVHRLLIELSLFLIPVGRCRLVSPVAYWTGSSGVETHTPHTRSVHVLLLWGERAILSLAIGRARQAGRQAAGKARQHHEDERRRARETRQTKGWLAD